MNIATLAPHGPVRISAMGLAKGSPSKSQMKKMRAMVERAMKDGALGLSTGLIYPPGMYSDTDELFENNQALDNLPGSVIKASV